MNRLRAFENMVLRKIIRPKRAETGGGRSLIMKGFTIVLVKREDGQIEQDLMGGACSTPGTDHRYTRSSNRKT
jgi:hypothetical protein